MLPSQKPGWKFGPFELDIEAEELLRGPNRIRLAGQPFQILLMLLEHPGEVVTRDHLRERLWSDGTFVDFEHGLNAAMNKLRRALGDAAENPRYVETVPGRGYRFIGAVVQDDSRAEERSANSHPPPAPTAQPPPEEELRERRRKSWALWAGLTAACMLSLLLGITLLRRTAGHQPEAPWKLIRLSDPGTFAETPALSRDALLVAYSADPGGKGQRDIYVRQVAGGQPIRLTTDGSENTAPDFSPDGSRIVFQSSRDGGGIYIIRTFGGELRLLARNGRSPKFSPDGSLVAFWIGGPGVATAVPGDGEVWIVASTGGAPLRLAQNLTNSRYPIWAPDGRHLLALGYDSPRLQQASELDWWLLAADGHSAVRTGMADALAAAHLKQLDPSQSGMTLPNLPLPGCWTADPDRVVFAAHNGDSASLWTAAISPRTGRVTGELNRLTTGAASEVQPSCTSANALVFTDRQELRDVWLLPVDLNLGVVKGPLARVTEGLRVREHAALSRDATLLAYASAQQGPMNIFVKDLRTGAETRIADSPNAQRFPVITPSGMVAFSMFGGSGRSVYLSTPEGAEKLCDTCLRATDWAADGRSFLTFAGSPYQIGVFDLATRKVTSLLQRQNVSLLYGRFSPDEHWISFTMRTQPGRSQIMIAPLKATLPIPETAWIKVADVSEEDWANWSPDGKTLYFTSARDGHFCLWGQRLDPKNHAPAGTPFPLLHLHGNNLYTQGGWSAAGSRVAIVLSSGARDVWIMSR